jgi:hypothetical protein
MTDRRRGVLVEALMSSQIGLFSVVHLAIDRRVQGTSAPARTGTKKKKGGSVASSSQCTEELVRSTEMWNKVATFMSLWHPQLRFLLQRDAPIESVKETRLKSFEFDWLVANVAQDEDSTRSRGKKKSKEVEAPTPGVAAFSPASLVSVTVDAADDSWEVKANSLANCVATDDTLPFPDSDTLPLWRMHVFVRQDSADGKGKASRNGRGKSKGKGKGTPSNEPIRVDVLMYYSHSIGDGVTAAVFSHDIAKAASLVMRGSAPSVADELVTDLPVDIDAALWGPTRTPKRSTRVAKSLLHKFFTMGGAKIVMKERAPLMPNLRGDEAVGDLAWSKVGDSTDFLAFVAAGKEHGVRPNAMMLAAAVFVKAALQRKGMGRRAYSYDCGFPVAMRSDQRSHTPGLHASPTDVVFAPAVAQLFGKVKDSTSFWELAKRMQQDTDKACQSSKLSLQKSLILTIFPAMADVVLPRGAGIAGDVVALNLGRWPYEEAAFPGVDILAYRLCQASVHGAVLPGIMFMWFSALPNGAHTWSAQYARPAFPSRADATDFVQAFADLVFDLPTRQGDVTIGAWMDEIEDSTPILQYIERVKEAEKAGSA